MIRSKLKHIRLNFQYTYEFVGKSAGMSKEAYWMIENGKRGLSYENAVRIARVFNLAPDAIFLQQELTNSEQKTIDKEEMAK